MRIIFHLFGRWMRRSFVLHRGLKTQSVCLYAGNISLQRELGIARGTGN
jgi:hypothetical protein